MNLYLSSFFFTSTANSDVPDKNLNNRSHPIANETFRNDLDVNTLLYNLTFSVKFMR